MNAEFVCLYPVIQGDFLFFKCKIWLSLFPFLHLPGLFAFCSPFDVFFLYIDCLILPLRQIIHVPVYGTFGFA